MGLEGWKIGRMEAMPVLAIREKPSLVSEKTSVSVKM